MTDSGFDPARLARLDKQLARHVDEGRLAGWQVAITRHDELAHEAVYGWRDREARLPVESDTVWRIASMTKPVTSVTAMSLWEEGAFDLNDPISRWLPEFADMRVYVGGVGKGIVTVPATEPIRVWHLLSHTSGLTAGFMRASYVDELYRDAGYELGSPLAHQSIAGCVTDWAGLPLLFQPGTAWGYGVSHDVLGRLIEIWSGQTLDVAFQNRVLDPLGMVDTGFWCQDPSRLAALYAPDEDDLAQRASWPDPDGLPPILSGGGGLVSTTADYVRFTRMLAGRGALEGTRVLAPRTVDLMRANHLTADLAQLKSGGFAETSFEGVGFGLGFAVMVDPVKGHSIASRGEYNWGGIFSTCFWVDPVEDLTCVFMAQLMPSSTLPLRPQLRQLVYSALVS